MANLSMDYMFQSSCYSYLRKLIEIIGLSIQFQRSCCLISWASRGLRWTGGHWYLFIQCYCAAKIVIQDSQRIQDVEVLDQCLGKTNGAFLALKVFQDLA